jgi:hypothetical protein
MVCNRCGIKLLEASEARIAKDDSGVLIDESYEYLLG